MITRLSLENVLAFQNVDLEFRRLTLLSGTNSSGKSSLLHVLAALRQSHDAKTFPTAILLNGAEVELGTGRDVLHSEPIALQPDDVLGLRVRLVADDVAFEWIATYEMEADVLHLANPTAEPLDGLFTPGFQYLRADRIVPQVTYPKSHEAVVVRRSLGPRGEHAPNYLRVHGESPIQCAAAAHPAAVSQNLIDQTNAWLDVLSPGTSLAVEDVAGTDYVRLSFYRSGPEVRTEAQRATNVGFGLTYALPVVVACLTATPGSLTLVENPEAHLHPKGQAVLGRMCALAASTGAQFVVETHSDHVLNAVRLAVKESELESTAAIIHFFSRSAGVLQPELQTIEIGDDGMIPSWPADFFDEWDRALDKLLR